MNIKKLNGLVAAPFTPFNRDGSLNAALIPQLAARMIQGGVVGVFVCGTTGEGPSMTTEERKQVAEQWVAASGDRLRVIVHVGHSNLEDARALATHAQAIGAAGVGALAPFFFKPKTIADIVETMVRHGGTPAGKAIMAMTGLDCGPVRPPLRDLSPAELASLRGDLVKLGFLPESPTGGSSAP